MCKVTSQLARMLSLCLWLSSASLAHAQSAAAPAVDRTEEAKGLFGAGRAAFEAGRYADALDYFQRSYTLSQRPELLYNIGIVQDRMRDDEHALESYDAYLAAVPNAPNRIEVEKRAAAIRAALANRPTQAPAAAAPTPTQTAEAAPRPAANAATAPTDRDPEPAAKTSIFSRWWFWTAVGVVVAGGVTAGAIIASGGDDEPESPLAPKSGVVVTTLRVAP